MEIEILVNHDDIARRGLAQYWSEVKRRGHDMRPAWDAVLDVIHRREARLFEREGADSEHPRWPELSDRPIRFHRLGGVMVGYATWKRATHPGRKILELTGRLKAQLTGENDEAYCRRGVRRLTFGTDYTDYSGVPGRPRSPLDRLTGDLGGITANGRDNYFPMPERPPIRVDWPFAHEIGDRALDYLLDAREI